MGTGTKIKNGTKNGKNRDRFILAENTPPNARIMGFADFIFSCRSRNQYIKTTLQKQPNQDQKDEHKPGQTGRQPLYFLSCAIDVDGNGHDRYSGHGRHDY